MFFYNQDQAYLVRQITQPPLVRFLHTVQISLFEILLQEITMIYSIFMHNIKWFCNFPDVHIFKQKMLWILLRHSDE